MESIIRDEIVFHLMKHNLLTDDQHGFVPGRDCITQLLVCIDKWTELIDERQNFDVIYTDFSKAFDSVPHERLFVKLKSLGIRGDILKWIKSFLRGRVQCVSVDGEKSSWKDVLSGIPQGSVLGPILFVIFINDMPLEVKHNICKLFADDCKLFGIVNDYIPNTMQSDLSKLEDWSTIWQLPFNANKCKAMHFGKSNPKHIYHLNGHELESTNSEKDVGVRVDNNLKFHFQSAYATKKANQMLGVIKKTYKARDAFTIPTLYKSLVRPHLEYGNVIWGPHYAGDKKMIESVQRRATKMVSGLHDTPYQKRLKLLNLPSLDYRRSRGDMIQCFKIMKDQVRMKKYEIFTPIPSSNTRGHSMRILRRGAKKLARINVFSQRVIQDWNSLPQTVVDAPSLNAFKNRLDEHWKERKFVSISV